MLQDFWANHETLGYDGSCYMRHLENVSLI